MDDSMAYVAYCKCGGMIFASVDDERGLTINAKEFPELRKAGFKIDRINCKTVRASRWCKNRGKCKDAQPIL